MGVFDSNQSQFSRNYQTQAQAQAQKFQNNFHKHNQEYAQRNRLTGAARAGWRARRTAADGVGNAEDPGIGAGQGLVPKRRWSKSFRTLSILMVVLIGSAVFVHTPFNNNDVSETVRGILAKGVDGSVRPGVTYNVRRGPSKEAQIIDQVHSGEKVVVLCLKDGWAKLSFPNNGAFVAKQGLSLEGTPPAC